MAHEQFTFTLPLTLGAETAYAHTEGSALSTALMEIAITVPIAPLRNAQQCQNHILTLNIAQLTHKNQDIHLHLTTQSPQSPTPTTNSVPVNLTHQQTLPLEHALFPFRIRLTLTPRSLLAQIRKISYEFKLTPLPRSKFVKNQRLQLLIKHHLPEWGLLTMDQSQRMVLQSQTTSFPAIGLWLSGPTLTPIQTVQKLSEYLSLILPRKCKFLLQNRKFFYLAQCPPSAKTPQLLLVEWTPPQQIISKLDYPLDLLLKQQEITLRSDQHSLLEFTLRSDEKVPQKLKNIDCSPILFQEESPEQTSIDLLSIRQLQNEKYKQKHSQAPDSPRFHHRPQNRLEIECASLRRLVQMQQKQINQLRAQLLRVTSALSLPKDHTPSTARTTRPSKDKILTEHDLSLGSTPSSDSPSTLSSNDPKEEWNPWQHFQIVEK